MLAEGMSKIAEMLGQVPLFADLDEAERAVLAGRVRLVRFAAGHVLFNSGDPGDSMYVIQSGEVQVFVKTKTGERVVLETAGPRDFFGEISLLDGGSRTAAALATKDVEAFEVSRADLDELFRLKPAAALDLLSAAGRRLRQTALLLRNTASRNVNEEVADSRTVVMKVADWIADFSGSLPFLFIHIAFFFFWIILNTQLFTFVNFDPFPFGLLTTIVSLEAIILSVFVLLSQNRQAERERVRSDVEYDVNLKAELQIQHLHEKLDRLNEDALARLARIERALLVRESV